MKSSVYICRLKHTRTRPEYSFSHNIYMLALDLDEIAGNAPALLGFNRANVFSFRDRDHFRFESGTVQSTRTRINEYFQALNRAIPTNVLLLTNLRVFGYVFNPVSFYFCTFESDRPAILVEVNNTYGEQKPFLLDHLPQSRRKNFYVSPFIRNDMNFYFHIRKPSSNLRIEISSQTSDQKTIMRGTIAGIQKRLSTIRLLGLLFQFPFLTLRIIALIHWHALRLYLKGVPHFSKKQSDAQLRENQNV
ncbi:MAG: DUF1365 domain-containing protein [Spirochaetia bacterium]|nr:DUF1365 domain-containing protein [Spirochaetia bacterium]